MTIWIISDQHYGHRNIAGPPPLSSWDSGYRNFRSLREMEDTLVDNINAVVQPNDEIYDLGDIIMGQSPETELPRIRARINCRNFHIASPGNHHPFDKHPQLKSLFSSYTTYRELKYKKQLFCLFHYPILSWNSMHHGSIHLFGHVHENVNCNWGRRINMCVECWDYKPQSLDYLLELGLSLPIKSEGHHTGVKNG